MTARLRTCAAEWHEVRDVSDEELARRIREDRIDILFDLAGHTPGNRLPVFARKPAPVQITWLDYVGTTGLSAMDYLLADPRQIPAGAEAFHTEKVLRMPDDYICFDPPVDAPAVGPLPALTGGLVTFGSFNLLTKTSPQSVEIWSRILREVPGSRLMLKNHGFDQPATMARLRRLFSEHAIDPSRIVFQGRSPHAELLAAYNEVDVGLDTLPYNGGLTTCEALWMGVPVVTCPGETFASRHGLAHLTAAGVAETVAADFEDYVRIAVALAGDLPRLSALREGLRGRVGGSALCDGKRFAGYFADVMRGVWRRWCEGK
jgi:predicted O-linked N-acetylglucosamine transferase (SPINDLY family)